MKVFGFICCLILVSCAIPAPSGGPCDYEKIAVQLEVTKVYGDQEGYQLQLTPLEKKNLDIFERSYTSSVQLVEANQQKLTVGDRLEGLVTVMTSGSCNPRPFAVELNDSVALPVVDEAQLKQ